MPVDETDLIWKSECCRPERLREVYEVAMVSPENFATQNGTTTILRFLTLAVGSVPLKATQGAAANNMLQHWGCVAIEVQDCIAGVNCAE
jgi:hypothetical protein